MSEYSKSPLRSELGRVRGLGSSKHGARHWWLERMTALALIPLTLWFVINLVTHLLGADIEGVKAWVSNPVTALLLAALSGIMFIHTRMGIAVIIEDYVHCECKKIALLIIKDVIIYTLLAGTFAAIAQLHFVGI